jgi:dTMP kinase
MSEKKGLFITIEGGEGSGKTTLIESIGKYLLEKEFDVIATREPGGTDLGENIRNFLLSYGQDEIFSSRAELALFLASRSQHVEEVITPALNEGKIVICDRYNDSSIAYQGYARGLDLKTVKSSCEFFSFGLNPELTFYLDIDPKIGLERVRKASLDKSISYDRIESEDIAFHQKVREAFHKMAILEKDRFNIVDAAMSPKEVFDQVISAIEEKLK